MDRAMTHDVIVVGGGPAGMMAAMAGGTVSDEEKALASAALHEHAQRHVGIILFGQKFLDLSHAGIGKHERLRSFIRRRIFDHFGFFSHEIFSPRSISGSETDTSEG